MELVGIFAYFPFHIFKSIVVSVAEENGCIGNQQRNQKVCCVKAPARSLMSISKRLKKPRSSSIPLKHRDV